MPPLEWKDAFATGIAYIDYEHRRLIGLINRICADLARAESAGAGSDDVVGDALALLHARISAHFALEESLMRERGYRFYEAHKAGHERMLDEIRTMMDAYEDGFCETCGRTLDDCLQAWFHKHFEAEDALLAELPAR